MTAGGPDPSREILRPANRSAGLTAAWFRCHCCGSCPDWLIDIHGQHDQQAIFQTDTHLQLLDRYGGEPVARPGRSTSMLLAGVSGPACGNWLTLGQDPAERARQVDMLQYQIHEIEAARIKADEDEKLTQRRRIVANAEKIRACPCRMPMSCWLAIHPATILASLGQVVSRLDQAASAYCPSWTKQAAQVAEAMYPLAEYSRRICGFSRGSETRSG